MTQHLEYVMKVAEKVGGRDHHYKFIQTQYNRSESEIATITD